MKCNTATLQVSSLVTTLHENSAKVKLKDQDKKNLAAFWSYISSGRKQMKRFVGKCERVNIIRLSVLMVPCLLQIV